MSVNRVLLVENDTDTREITGLLLGHAGYDVVAAHDLESGIALSCAMQDIGLVMADMYLGGGQEGSSLIRNIRCSDAHMPVVLTSADNEASAVARELNVVFLPKPYGRMALLSAIACACANSSACTP